MWKYQDSNKLIWVSCLNLLCFQHTKKHSKHSLVDDITPASIFQQPSGFRFKLIDLEKPWMCQFLFSNEAYFVLFSGWSFKRTSEDHFLPKNTFRSSASHMLLILFFFRSPLRFQRILFSLENGNEQNFANQGSEKMLLNLNQSLRYNFSDFTIFSFRKLKVERRLFTCLGNWGWI